MKITRHTAEKKKTTQKIINLRFKGGVRIKIDPITGTITAKPKKS